VRRAALREGEKALVVGGGPIGVLIACVGADHGRRRARARAERGRGVRSRSRSDCTPSIRPPATCRRFVADWTAGAGAEVAFEVSGADRRHRDGDPVTGRARPPGRGRDPRHAPPVNLFRVFWRELTLIGARVYERSDFEEAVRCSPAARFRRSIDDHGSSRSAIRRRSVSPSSSPGAR
jgi:(R,R)-butanediol dehydrogenase/meso-butanediol dehydrogenase/diacetyl reductase